MQEFWGYDFKKGWIEELDFISAQLDSTEESDVEKIIKSLGYRDGFGVYQLDDSTLGNPIQLYELAIKADLPKYIIEYCPTGCDVTFFVARNMPSLIELLAKLVPLAQAVKVCEKLNDIDNEKFNK